MFCEEPIIKVYYGIQKTFEGDYFLDCYHDLAFHVTNGCRLLLETTHNYISIDINGVEKLWKGCALFREGEYLEPCVFILADNVPWGEFESTLFVGERLLEVVAERDHFLAVFDDFSLKVIPYDSAEALPGLYSKAVGAYHHIYGCERLLKRCSTCGSEGEILLDFVSDYVVRCKNCKCATWAGMNIQDAIDDWNKGILPCQLDSIAIE